MLFVFYGTLFYFVADTLYHFKPMW